MPQPVGGFPRGCPNPSARPYTWPCWTSWGLRGPSGWPYPSGLSPATVSLVLSANLMRGNLMSLSMSLRNSIGPSWMGDTTHIHLDIEPVLPTKTFLSFRVKDSVGHSKGFSEVQIDNICSSSLFHWYSHSHRGLLGWPGKICPWLSHAGCLKGIQGELGKNQIFQGNFYINLS